MQRLQPFNRTRVWFKDATVDAYYAATLAPPRFAKPCSRKVVLGMDFVVSATQQDREGPMKPFPQTKRKTDDKK